MDDMQNDTRPVRTLGNNANIVILNFIFSRAVSVFAWSSCRDWSFTCYIVPFCISFWID